MVFLMIHANSQWAASHMHKHINLMQHRKSAPKQSDHDSLTNNVLTEAKVSARYKCLVF